MMLALHRACQEENLILVSILLERGLNVNAKDKQGRTALHIASEKGDKLLAELLFQRGADTCSVSSRGEIPLDSSHDEGMTLLLVQMMARAGKGELAQERLQFGKLSEKVQQRIAKELDIKVARKKTPPAFFTQLFGKRPLASFLGLKESDSRLSSLSNVSNSSRLSIAESGFSEMDRTPDNTSMESVQTNASTSSGFASVDETTPLFNRRATTALTKEEFKCLNRSPFMPRCRAFSEPPSRTIKRSSTWTSQSTHNTFPRPAMNKRLKRHVTFPSNVLLDIAIKNDDFVEACHLIKSRKVDFNRIGSNGLTPLHRAAIEGSYECLQLLIDLGANITAQDEFGWTPLHDAVFHGHISCAMTLIKAGADICAETFDLRTILDVAKDDIMIRVVGRAMASKFCEGEEYVFYPEQELIEPVYDPDRETCV